MISPDPVCPTYICDIYVPKCGLLLTVENVESAERRINMSRFVIRDQLAAARGRMRLAHKCAEVMLTEAEQHFASCAELHFELERIYSSAMNFGLLDVYTSKLCERIISVADEAAAKPDCEKC